MIDDKTLKEYENFLTRVNYVTGADLGEHRVLELVQALRKERRDKKVLVKVLESIVKNSAGFDPPHEYWRDHLAYETYNEACAVLEKVK